jgi:hypothetical protein
MLLSEEVTCLRGLQNMDEKKNPTDGPDAVDHTLQKSHSPTKASYIQLGDVDRRRLDCFVRLYEDDSKMTIVAVTAA